MTSNYFGKVPLDLLNDPRFALLTPEQWRLALECYLTACRGQTAVLPAPATVAFAVRKDVAWVEDTLADMPDLFAMTPAGFWTCLFWDDWQALGGPKARQRLARAKQAVAKAPTEQARNLGLLADHFCQLRNPANPSALRPKDLYANTTTIVQWVNPLKKMAQLEGGDLERTKARMKAAAQDAVKGNLTWATPLSLEKMYISATAPAVGADPTAKLDKIFYGGNQ